MAIQYTFWCYEVVRQNGEYLLLLENMVKSEESGESFQLP